jgi:hypothetical protein
MWKGRKWLRPNLRHYSRMWYKQQKHLSHNIHNFKPRFPKHEEVGPACLVLFLYMGRTEREVMPYANVVGVHLTMPTQSQAADLPDSPLWAPFDQPHLCSSQKVGTVLLSACRHLLCGLHSSVYSFCIQRCVTRMSSIGGVHSEHSYCSLLGYDTVQSGKLVSTFWRHILPHFYPEDGSSTFFRNISNSKKIIWHHILHSHRCQNLKPHFDWEQLYTSHDYYVFGHYTWSCFLFKTRTVSESGFCLQLQVKA